jgi:hypothetical protein
MTRLRPGAKVRVRLFDARLVEGTICAGGIIETTSGTKVRVLSGPALYLVNADQIQKVTRGGAR